KHPIFGYTTTEPQFKTMLIDWFKRRYNWDIDWNWVSLSPGVLPAISLMVTGLTKSGDKIIVQPPIYPPFRAKVELNGRILAENPLLYDAENGRYTVDYENLEQVAAAPDVTMFILSNPHNPVGRNWTPEELTKMAHICIAHDVKIISDEIHCDLMMPGQTFTPIATLSDEIAQHVITCMAPSKTFNLAGMKYSHILIQNEAWQAQFRHDMTRMHLSGPNAFGIVAAEAAYTKGEAWLEAVIAYVFDNYQFMKSFFAEHCPAVKVTQLEGTYLTWLDFNTLKIEHDELVRRLNEEAKVHLNSGTDFGEEGRGFMRLNVATPRANLEEALQRMIRVL
ncbi:MAG: MalY/PatB family protein, partial [Chloroflexota bacterium]